MKTLMDLELEFVAGGHISIISPGEGIPNEVIEARDRSGGATGGW